VKCQNKERQSFLFFITFIKCRSTCTLSLLSRGPLALCDIRVILKQMFVALTALKTRGMMHADIKPDNIMLVNQSQQPYKVKLIDFGFATSPAKIPPGTIIQALSYRAPEVMLGIPVTESADMWTLGCVAAFLYLGHHLFFNRCEYQMMQGFVHMLGQPSKRMLQEGNTTITDKYASAFLSLLKWMLCVDPVKRITPVEGLGHRFITMKHLPEDPAVDCYTKSSCTSMEVCPLLSLENEIDSFVTTSEIKRNSGVPPASRPGARSLRHGWLPAELTGASLQLPLASAPRLLSEPSSGTLLSSFWDSGAAAPLLVFLGLLCSGGLWMSGVLISSIPASWPPHTL
uniref:Protein kinase domain-containing protein n=1 Tax=Maylandia zebra TaxID=106582 RepID=A0A3P9DG86_9CICH